MIDHGYGRISLWWYVVRSHGVMLRGWAHVHGEIDVDACATNVRIGVVGVRILIWIGIFI